MEESEKTLQDRILRTKGLEDEIYFLREEKLLMQKKISDLESEVKSLLSQVKEMDTNETRLKSRNQTLESRIR